MQALYQLSYVPGLSIGARVSAGGRSEAMVRITGLGSTFARAERAIRAVRTGQ